MENIDPEEERTQLKETYEQMTEDELCAVADDAYDLTPLAQETLQAEISGRGLTIELKTTPPPPDLDSPPMDTDGLVGITRLWDESEAKRVKGILDAASIPSCLGPDNIVDLADFKGNFDAGVDLKVRTVDQGHASATLAQAASQEEEEEDQEDQEDENEFAVVCPKCHSPEIVFEGRDPQATTAPPADAKFKWNCDACGYQWEDDGVEQSV